MITEREKKQIRTRANAPLKLYNNLEIDGKNPPAEILDDCNVLIDEANELILANKNEGKEILRLVNKRAIELEKILNNYD